VYVNGKMRSVKTIPGMGGSGIKGNDGGWIQLWCIWHIIRTFVNATVYPQHTKKIENKWFLSLRIMIVRRKIVFIAE
jgi:hypothetical protein